MPQIEKIHYLTAEGTPLGSHELSFKRVHQQQQKTTMADIHDGFAMILKSCSDSTATQVAREYEALSDNG